MPPKPKLDPSPLNPNPLKPGVGVKPGWKFPIKLSIPGANECVYLGPGSHIRTELDFSAFFSADHTLSAWFMPQFVHGWYGPVFASTDGQLLIGQGDYTTGNLNTTVDPKVAGDAVLTVIVNGSQAIYVVPGWKKGKWQHLAAVRAGSSIDLYLNGTKLSAVTVGAAGTSGKKPTTPAPSAAVPAGYVPTGPLVLGSCHSPISTPGTAQAYGLLDDVGVFDRALTAEQIQKLVAAKRLTGYEEGLIAGWGLDTGKVTALLPPLLRGETTEYDIPTEIKVSADRNDDEDGPLLDNAWVYGGATPSVPLPLAADKVWRIQQSINSPTGSHMGRAAFSYDIACEDGATANADVYAAVSGTVVAYWRDGPLSGPREPNRVVVMNPNGDLLEYLHLAADSLSDSVTGGEHTSSDVVVPYPSTARQVKQGEKLAEIGPGAAHLHLAGTELHGDDAFDTAWSQWGTTCLVGFKDVEVMPKGKDVWEKPGGCYLPKSGDRLRRI